MERVQIMKFKILTNYSSVEEYLKSFLKLSKKNIHTIRMESHHNNIILINNTQAALNAPLKSGDILEINIALGVSNYIKNSSTLNIPVEYEDDYLLIVSKPNGLKTHPNDISSEDDTLLNYLIPDYEYLEPIHRLDIDTSGLVILAKTPLVKAKLDLMLEQRAIKRYYTALVKNKISPQQVKTNIGRDKQEKNKMAVTQNGKVAITNILNCDKLDQNIFALTISLETGRTHQIRVHLAHLKSPILGDPLYSKDSIKYDKMHLAALKIEFLHPVTEEKIQIDSSFRESFLEIK